MGAVVAGVPRSIVLGTLAVLLVMWAVVYRAALGLAILAFFYPWDLTTRAGPVKLTTSAALLGILFLVWAVRAAVSNSSKRRDSPLDTPVMLFAAATVLSLLSLLGPTGDADAELVGLLKAAGGFLLFFLTVRGLDDRRDLWIVVGAILATGAVQSLITIMPVLSGAEHVSVVTRLSGTTIHPNLFAGYLLLIIPLVIAVAVGFRRRWPLLVAGVATAIYGAALIATLSRSGLLGLIAGTLALALLLPEKRKLVSALAGALVIVSFLGGMVGPFAARIAAAEANFTSFDGRLTIWGRAGQIFAHHIVFGGGVGNFQYALGQHDLSHAHNLLLNIAAERGTLGLAAFCLMIIVLFRTLATALRTAPVGPDRVLSAGLIASFVGFFVHSLFDATYYDYKILLLFWLLVGVAASLPRLFADRGAWAATPLALSR